MSVNERAVKAEQEKLQAGNEEKQRRSAELDSEIADKEERARKADRENTDNIKSGIANLLGKGKYAAIEKENRELKQSIPKEKERLKEEFAKRLEKELTRRTTEFAEREAGYKRQQKKLRQENGSLAAKYEAAGIKEFMNEYAETREGMLAVGNWLVGYSGI